MSISGKGKLVARGGTKERRAEVLQDVRAQATAQPWRGRLYWDEEQFSTRLDEPGATIQGAWVCPYCGEASKKRRGIKHVGCRWGGKKKR